jgi:hypothetical protein
MQLYERVTVLNDDESKNMLGTVVGTANYCVDDRDFTTMDAVGTMRTCFVVKLDLEYQGWLGEEVGIHTGRSYNGRSYISHLIVDEESLEPAPWFINVYEMDRGYGGPEEGGWWYDIRTPVISFPADSKRDAESQLDAIMEEYPSEGDRPVSSVIYSGGAYDVRIENHPPVEEPQSIPHYE